MSLREVMRTDFVTVSPDMPVAEAVRLLLDRNLAALPVVDGAGTVAGLVSRRDLVSKHARVHLPMYLQILGGVLPLNSRETDRELRHVLASTVGELMTHDPQKLPPEAEVDDAASLLVERNLDAVLVVEDGVPIGLVDDRTILKLLLVEEEGDTATAV